MRQVLSYGIYVLIAVSIITVGCDQRKIYDDYVDMEGNVWHEDSLATFNFKVEDASINYPMMYNVRYAIDYPYYNLYVTYYLEDSSSNILDSELQELILFDRKTGVPLGDGLGDIIDLQVPVFEGYKFSYEGNYTLKVKQFMRIKQLPGIMSYGLRIELPLEEE